MLREVATRAAEDPAEYVRIFFVPQTIVSIIHEDEDLACGLSRLWLQSATEPLLEAPHIGQLVWALALRESPLAETAILRLLRSGDPKTRKRGGNLAILLQVKGVGEPIGRAHCLDIAMQDPAARRGVADFLTQLLDELPAGRPETEGRSVSKRTLVDLADDDDAGVREQAMDALRYANRPLIEYADLLSELSESRGFSEKPGNLLRAISQRRDEIPHVALDLCEKWATAWASTSADHSRAEALDGYSATEIVLAVYSHAEPGGETRKRCLDLIDEFLEKGVGGVESKMEALAIHP